MTGDLHTYFSQYGTICNIIPGHKRVVGGGLHHMYVQFEKVRVQHHIIRNHMSVLGGGLHHMYVQFEKVRVENILSAATSVYWKGGWDCTI